MHIPLSFAIHLLHQTAQGVVATQSAQLPGYPFATLLPLALDECHRPLLLVSRLAEHTKNLLANPRVSLLVSDAQAPSVLAGARLTLTGDMRPAEVSDELIARYLRYLPEAENYLALGDFSFFRLQPKRSRYIEGFGRMGWVEEADWNDAVSLPLAEETALLHATQTGAPSGLRLLGIDLYGFDIEQAGHRKRLRFDDGPVPADSLVERVNHALAAA